VSRSSSGGAPHADLQLGLRRAREGLAREDLDLGVALDDPRTHLNCRGERRRRRIRAEKRGRSGVDERFAVRAAIVTFRWNPGVSFMVTAPRRRAGRRSITGVAIVLRTEVGAGMLR
jgi:hypothetical protein